MTACDVRVVLPRHIYRAPPYRGIVEYEFCPVYVARATSEPVPNPLEVGACAWIEWKAFVRAAETDKRIRIHGGARISCPTSSTTR